MFLAGDRNTGSLTNRVRGFRLYMLRAAARGAPVLIALALANTSVRAESVYLQGLSEVRLVVSAVDAEPRHMVSAKEIESNTAAMLRASLPALEIKPAAHAYVYVKIVARATTSESVFAVVDLRVVRPVIVIPIGRVTLASVWEQHRVVSAFLNDFGDEALRALGVMIEQLGKDWRHDNRAD